MNFKSLFLLILSLTTGLSTVDTYTASAISKKRLIKIIRCTGKTCPIYSGRSYGSTIIPALALQQLNDRINQGTATVGDYLLVAYDSARKQDFAMSETRYKQALELAEKEQDLDGQAAAHKGLGGVYMKIGKSELSSSYLKNAGQLYQKLGNSQRFKEVRLQQLRNTQL